MALARALGAAPKVLLLDEPLSALDLKLRKEMQIELKRMQLETGITFIFVTHDQEEALTMSDRIAVMSKGKILQIGSPAEIYEHPTVRFVADFIGETNFIEAEVTQRIGNDGQIKLPSGVVINHPVGRECRRRRQGHGGGPAGTHRSGAAPASRRISPAWSRTSSISAPTRTFHIKLDGVRRCRRADVTVRVQNRRGHQEVLTGRRHAWALRIAPEAMQILKD